MKGRGSFNFSRTTNICARYVFPSPFNLDICIVNCTKETEGIQWEKASLNSLASRWSVSFELSFCGRKTRFTNAIAANKQANSNNFKIKNLNLLTITFLAVYLMNRGKSSYMDNHRWEWIILSVRSLTVFEENIVFAVLQTSFVVFQKWTCYKVCSEAL